MSTQLSIRQRYQELPKRTRGALGVIAAVLLYLFLDDYSWSLARQWNLESAEVEELLAEGERQMAPLPRPVEVAVRAYGLIEVPGNEADGSHSLAKAVNDIVKRHRVGSFSFEARSASRLPSGALSGSVDDGQRLERVLGEVSFEVAPEDLATILAEIEANPAVDAIGAIRMDWLDAPKRVSVRMSVEAWVTTTRGARRTT